MSERGAHSKKPVILCVDDEMGNRTIFEFILRDKFKVLLASCADDARKVMIGQDNIRAIVSDFSMPGQNGIEFLSGLRHLKTQMHFIVVSGYMDEQEIHDALDSGLIDLFIPKPYDPAMLLAKLQELIDSGKG